MDARTHATASVWWSEDTLQEPLFLPQGSWRLSSARQRWQQAPLPAKSSH